MASPTPGAGPATPGDAVRDQPVQTAQHAQPASGGQSKHARPVTAPPARSRDGDGAQSRMPTLEELRNLPVAVIGMTVVLAGVVLQLVAIVGATWFSTTVGGADYTLDFSGFRDRTQRGLAFVYFGWGAWLLLVVTLALGVAACVRWRWARVFQVFGALVGVLGAFVTIGALLVFVDQAPSDQFQVIRHYTLGIYLAVIGCLATAIGSVAGGAGGAARRRR